MAERTDYGHEDLKTAEQPKSEVIRRDIESTRAALDEKLDALQTKVRDVQTKAKQAFNLNHQVAEHPWGMFGASIAAGFGLGLLLGGSSEDRGWSAYPTMFDQAHLPTRSIPDRFTGHYDRAVDHYAATPQRSAGSDIVETLKLAAGAAVTDLVRQTIHRYVPQLGTHLDKIWKERGLTPTSLASSLFGSSQQGPAQPGAEAPGGGRYGAQSPGQGGYGSTSYSAAGADPARNFDPSAEPSREPVGRAEMTTRS